MNFSTQEERNEIIERMKTGLRNYSTMVGPQMELLYEAIGGPRSDMIDMSTENMVSALDDWYVVNNTEQAWEKILCPKPNEDLAARAKNFREEHRFPKEGQSNLGLNAKTLRQKAETLRDQVKTTNDDEKSVDEMIDRLYKFEADKGIKNQVVVPEQNRIQIEMIKSVSISVAEVAGGYTLFKVGGNLKATTRREQIGRQVVRFAGVGLMIHGIFRQLK